MLLLTAILLVFAAIALLRPDVWPVTKIRSQALYGHVGVTCRVEPELGMRKYLYWPQIHMDFLTHTCSIIMSVLPV